jgi:hypothetical protein
MIAALVLSSLHLAAAFFAIRKLRKARAFSKKMLRLHIMLCLLIPFFWSLFTLAASHSRTPEIMASHNRGKLRSDNAHNNPGSYSNWIS